MATTTPVRIPLKLTGLFDGTEDVRAFEAGQITARIVEGTFDGQPDLQVDVVYALPVDRPTSGGWSLGPDTKRTRALAQRLKAAVDALAVMPVYSIRRDITGQTYVSAPSMVLGRTLNADLRRLGF